MSDTQPMCGKYRSYAKYSKASIFAPHTKSITGSSFWCFGSEEHGMTKKTEEKIWGHFSASKVKRRIKVMTSLSFTISWSLLRLMAIESEMLSSHLITCCPLLLLLSTFPPSWSFSTSSSHHVAKILELQHQSSQ